MDKLVYLLPILACPVMMGAMMWMMRGNHKSAGTSTPAAQEISVLRTEIAALRAEQAASTSAPAAAVAARDLPIGITR